jgi:hypothetical protein
MLNALDRKPACATMELDMATRRFPPLWSVEEQAACFVVVDHSGQKLAYIYFEDEPGRRSAGKLLGKDEAHQHEDALERMNARFQADPSLIHQRRCASEHPFGTIKRMTAGGRFLTRGLNKARVEAALSVLAYNIIRTINLIGAANLKTSLA